jgi:hypothetical protein
VRHGHQSDDTEGEGCCADCDEKLPHVEHAVFSRTNHRTPTALPPILASRTIDTICTPICRVFFICGFDPLEHDINDGEIDRASGLLTVGHSHRGVLPRVDRIPRNSERKHDRFLLPALKIVLLIFGSLLLPLRISNTLCGHSLL